MSARRFGSLFDKWKILRGDKVKITAGKDKGQTGTIARVLRDQNRVIVEGLNLVKKHIKRTKEQDGGIVTIEAPLHVSNVQVVDPVTGGAVRTAFRYLEDGVKVRITRGKLASGSVVEPPAVLRERKWARPAADGPKDTSEAARLLETIVAPALPRAAAAATPQVQ